MEHQNEVFEEILKEQDNCIKEITMEVAEKWCNAVGFRKCHLVNSSKKYNIIL